MLTQEESRDLLSKHLVEKHQEVANKAIADLPEKLRETAFLLGGRNAGGKHLIYYHMTAEERNRQEKLLIDFDALLPAERERVFACYFPKMAQYVEHSWQLLKHFPYQAGYTRKAFRTPNNPQLTMQNRNAWVLQLNKQIGMYHESVEWFATYAAYIGHGYAAYVLSPLFAAIIDEDGATGETVFDILLQSGRGEHEIAAMGQHVPRSLLMSSRAEGWEFIEKLLLAAQRQEGLRQTILEAIDECHPEAFLRMLRIIIDHDLARFSSVVRAFDVWLGYLLEASSQKIIQQTLEKLYLLLSDETIQQSALHADDAEMSYLALWTYGYRDVEAAIAKAIPLLEDSKVERRFAAVHFLAQTHIERAAHVLLPALADNDLRVVAPAVDCISDFVMSDTDLFEHSEALLKRLPDKPKALDSIVWNWNARELQPSQVAALLLKNMGTRDPKRLIPYLQRFSVYDRTAVAEKLAEQEIWDDETRNVLLMMLKDRSSYVRSNILKILKAKRNRIQSDDIPELEALLTRRSQDLRRGVLSLLSRQELPTAIASGERLIQSGQKAQRLAGLELLAILADKEQSSLQIKALAGNYLERYSELDKTESALLLRLNGEQDKIPTLDDALGLMNPDNRTPVPTLTKPDIQITTKAATASLLALDAFIHERREQPVMFEIYDGSREVLVGNMQHYHIKIPDLTKDTQAMAQSVPLLDEIRGWHENRTDDLRDADGLELMRMWVMLYYYQKESVLGFVQKLLGGEPTQLKLKYRPLIKQYLGWLLHLYPAEGAVDFLMDTIEYRLAEYKPEYATAEQSQYRWEFQEGKVIDWRIRSYQSNDFASHVFLAEDYYSHVRQGWGDKQMKCWWQLRRWIDEGISEMPRFRPPLWVVTEAHRIGAANDNDFYDLLLGSRGDDESHHYYNNFNDLRTLSGRQLPQVHHEMLTEYDERQRIYEACRERILEVEVRRGDLPTAASKAAMAIRTIPGSKWFVQVLQALGKDTLIRGYIYDNGQSKNSVFSKLLKGTYPTAEDTPEVFAETISRAKISEKRLIEASIYAPQWAHLAEYVLGWDGYTDAVWWIHAHTKDTHWSVDMDVRQGWAAQMDERTPLSAADLQEGGVDVVWFKQVYETLGSERWQIIYNAAKYASSSGGHTRARLFADAMLGQITRDELVTRMRNKRHQDSARALGLLPIPEEQREAVILERYQLLQEFLRGSRKVGNHRQESERIAMRIAMENLARTAGYPDPLRLQWAMEAQEIADMQDGPLIVKVDNVTVTLAINSFGEPNLTVEKIYKNGKTKQLQNIPSELKKHDDIIHLRERNTMIKQQASRMRRSLENSMCRMDAFTVNELANLLHHPVLKPLLEALVFVGDVGMGYFVDDGVALENHALDRLELPSEAELRLAHPYDLFMTGEWHLWQRHCFVTERIQPFKQVFRELYVMTDAERNEPHLSQRYAGHQVQPRQAMSLLGSRGWVIRPDEGVQKTFHREKIAAFLTFMHGYFTPASVEDLTISSVVFAEPGHWWKPIPLADVPPILFSEVMRDLDLVVSVAHSGGVDPEATASTVEMRTALLEETLVLLRIDNVRLEKNHAFVDGQLGTYSIHLGSAVVHRQPGGALCIIPVHSQHRGRLFLPFADDDPRTAEVLSKVILLARDDQIKDPTILTQLIG